MNRTNTGANTNTVQILIDIFLMIFSFMMSSTINYGKLDGSQYLGMAILCGVFTVIYVLSNKEGYLYNITLFYYLDRIHKKVTRSFVLALLCTAFLVHYVSEDEVCRDFYLIFLIIAYIVVCVKVFVYKPFTQTFHHGTIQRTAFVGRPGTFNKFKYFLNKTTIQLDEIGYIALNEADYDLSPDSYLGKLEDLESLIRTYNLDQVFILQKHGDELPFTQVYVDLCIKMGVTVRIIIDLYKRRRANSYVSTVGTYPVLAYHTVALNSAELVLKRFVDICCGIVGCVVFSPIMLITAIAIKIDSPGPVFFKQTRVGKNGRHFKIYKFRSMYQDAEARKKELMERNEIEGGVMFKLKDDPRITRVGKFIRKFSIDELPQFFNVLNGTMSMVGTRPPTLDEVEKYDTDQWRRISIKPGITGMWQVSGRSNIKEFDKIVELDVEYIDTWSLWLDFEIMLKTVMVLLKHDDAY